MSEGYGPVGIVGGKGYPAPLRGVERLPKLSSGEGWARKPTDPRARVGNDELCQLVWFGIRYDLPPRATVKVNRKTGSAFVRAGGEIFELVEGGRVLLSAERTRTLLEGWDSL